MELSKTIVEKALAARYAVGIKIRQPLVSYTTALAKKLDAEFVQIVTDEINVKELQFGSEEKLDIMVTPELKLEGQARELIRQINNLRKESGFTLSDNVILYQSGLDEVFATFGEEIKKATYLAEVKSEKIDAALEVAGGAISLKKIGKQWKYVRPDYTE